MIFVLSKVFWLMLRPSSLPLLSGWLGLGLTWRGRRRPGLPLLCAPLVFYSAVLLLPVDQWLLAPLENRFPQISTYPDQIDGIVVLGGALDTEVSEQRGMPALNAAAERMTGFVALARHYPDARLAFTGGNGGLLHAGMSEADAAKRLFDALGLADRGVLYESRSRNTYENAVFLRDLLKPEPGTRWILLTSAAHMPRSVGIFRNTGWTVLPWPVGYKTPRPLSAQLGMDFGQTLSQIDTACREYAGLVAYWLLGRTSALFPAPDAQDQN